MPAMEAAVDQRRILAVVDAVRRDGVLVLIFAQGTLSGST